MTNVGKIILACFLSLIQPIVWAQTDATKQNRGKVVLKVTGLIANAGNDGALSFDEAALAALPEQSFTTTAPWFKGKTQFSGPYLEDLLKVVGAKGTLLTMRALNDYKVQVPVSDASRYRPILARKINGKVISVREKGPLFLIYPFDSEPSLNTDVYFARSIWQIKSIHVE